jgi:hypothetical protein
VVIKTSFNFIASLVMITLGIQNCYSQNDWKPGFVINNEGDTLWGYIDNRDSRSNAQQCFFKNGLDKMSVVFSPAEIAAYRFTDGKFFVSRKIDEDDSAQPVFLEFMVQGQINLYHYRENDSHYYMEKDGKLHELKNTKEVIRYSKLDIPGTSQDFKKENREYIGMLTYLLQEADLNTEIAKSKLTPRSLINLTVKYQEAVCPDEECVIYEMNVKPVKVSWGIHSSIDMNTISFGYLIHSDYSQGFAIGGRMELENVIKWAEKVTISIDLNLQKFQKYTLYSGDSYSDEIIRYNNSEYRLKPESRRTEETDVLVNLGITAIKIPILLNYNFSKGPVQPYMRAGVQNILLVSKNKDFMIPRIHFNRKETIPGYLGGLTGGIGTRIKITSKQKVFLEFNYEYAEYLTLNRIFRFTNNLFALQAGLSF